MLFLSSSGGIILVIHALSTPSEHMGPYTSLFVLLCVVVDCAFYREADQPTAPRLIRHPENIVGYGIALCRARSNNICLPFGCCKR